MADLKVDVAAPPLPTKEEPLDAKRPVAKRTSMVQQHLRFPELKDLTVPPEYLVIDDALDLVGQHLYPNYWGYQIEFLKLPFGIRDGTLIHLGMRKNDKGWRRVYYRTKPSAGNISHLSQLYREYYSVWNCFSFGSNAGHFRLHYADLRLGIIPEPLGKGVIYLQKRSISLLGLGMPPGGDKHTRPLPVVVERERFLRWLTGPLLNEWYDIDDDNPIASAESVGINTRVVHAIVTFLENKDLRTTRPWLVKTLRSAMQGTSRAFRESEFDRRIWQPDDIFTNRSLKLTGRPRVGERTRWEQNEAQLIDAIRSALT